MRELIERYKREEISRQELEDGMRAYWEGLQSPDDPYRDFEGEEMWARIMLAGKRPARVKRMRWIPAVAAAVVLLTIGGYYYFSQSPSQPETYVTKQEVILPGKAGAVLTLSNGEKIVLDSAANGTVATDGKLQVVKQDGQIKYLGASGETVFHTISTDRSRTWKVSLPDGSRVWLNASSSIRYPLAFTGHERLVEITGEAYFEVVHNARQPFRVKAGDKLIEDIGTAFNINAYGDEPAFVTTVLEGKASVSTAKAKEILSAGMEAAIGAGTDKINLRKAQGLDAIAWRNGLFKFSEPASIEIVLRQISRWYNIEIQYPNGIPNKQFWGGIQRDLPLSEVLDILSKSKVHFKVEGRVLQVLP